MVVEESEKGKVQYVHFKISNHNNQGEASGGGMGVIRVGEGFGAAGSASWLS